jgi:long-subunit fatty acid transport protein
MGYQASIAYMINDYLSVAAGIRVVDSRSYIRADVKGVTIDVATSIGTFTTSPDGYLGMVADIATQIVDTINVSELSYLADGLGKIKQMQVDVTRHDVGITPVISLNYAPSLMTNWALKYEFRTNIDLVTTVNDGKDGNGEYIEGEIVNADIPAMLSIGVTRRPNRKIMIYSGIHYYFDKPVDFDGISSLSGEVIDDNTYEFAIGAEYRLTPELRASAGWLITRPGVNSSYQRENRFALASNTLGGVVGLRISSLVDLNLGISYTLFKKDEKELSYKPEFSEDIVTIREYYDTRKLVISAGFDFLFGEKR